LGKTSQKTFTKFLSECGAEGCCAKDGYNVLIIILSLFVVHLSTLSQSTKKHALIFNLIISMGESWRRSEEIPGVLEIALFHIFHKKFSQIFLS
jgi:hypothetical protein